MRRHASRSLVFWSWVALALLAAHDVTHVVDDGLETRLGQLAFVAVPQWLVLAVVTAVILRGDRARSRTAALLLGSGVTGGFAVVHLLPFSPASFWALQPSVVSWLLAWMAAAVGVMLAALAWPQPRPARPRPLGRERRHSRAQSWAPRRGVTALSPRAKRGRELGAGADAGVSS